MVEDGGGPPIPLRELRAYVGPAAGPDAGWRAHLEDTRSQRMTALRAAPDIEPLVGWARQHTGWVLVIDEGGRLHWAGDLPRPADVDRDWPLERRG